MDMSGERLIPASRDVVWQSLNDPSVLQVAIPGCQQLERAEGDALRAVAAVKVGPITARFAGKVSLLDLDPPNSYRIEGEGQGGAAGFAKGGATVRLEEADGGTRLVYKVHAQVGGKLAQLGSRLVDATAKQMSDAFFTRFTAEIERRQPGAAPGQEKAPAPGPAAANPPASLDIGSIVPVPWVVAVMAGLLAAFGAGWLLARRRGAKPIHIDADRLEDLRVLQRSRRR